MADSSADAGVLEKNSGFEIWDADFVLTLLALLSLIRLMDFKVPRLSRLLCNADGATLPGNLLPWYAVSSQPVSQPASQPASSRTRS